MQLLLVYTICWSPNDNTYEKILWLYRYCSCCCNIHLPGTDIYILSQAYIWINSETRLLDGAHNSDHRLWKLNDFIANAKMTAKNMQKPTTIMPDIIKKSCLYPKTSSTNCLTGIERDPSDSFTTLLSSPYCEVRRPYKLQATGFAQ